MRRRYWQWRLARNAERRAVLRSCLDGLDERRWPEYHADASTDLGAATAAQLRILSHL